MIGRAIGRTEGRPVGGYHAWDALRADMEFHAGGGGACFGGGGVLRNDGRRAKGKVGGNGGGGGGKELSLLLWPLPAVPRIWIMYS